jgi:hypothetical protein
MWSERASFIKVV